MGRPGSIDQKSAQNAYAGLLFNPAGPVKTMPKRPDAPDGWHWAIGERSPGYYTHWLYTDAVLYRDGEFGWEAEVYWDKGGEHNAVFRQYTKWDPEGDNETDYPSHSARFDTEEEALEYVVEKAAELR